MTVALSGSLRDFGIADVFQLIGQQRKTGVLEFTSDAGDGVQLRFDRGNVVSAAPVADRADEARPTIPRGRRPGRKVSCTWSAQARATRNSSR